MSWLFDAYAHVFDTTEHLQILSDNILHRGGYGKSTSIILGEHFDELIAQQLQTGRYGTASEVVRDALRMFEERQAAVQRLNEAIDEGYNSGFVDAIDWDALDQRADQAVADE